MKRILIIAIVTLFITLSAKGQNLFFIGEESYPSTKTYKLQANSDDTNDLNVIFAKDGKKKILGVSTKTVNVLIRGKLIIYLNDGTVITLADKGIYDYVDETASSVYYLTDEELSKMKESNINTVRYTLDSEDYIQSLIRGGNFSASNKGSTSIHFPALVTDFFEENKNIETDSDKKYLIQKEKNSEKEKSTPYELQWEGDLERAPMVQLLPENTSDTEATITIRFEVKPDGTIGRINPLRKMNPKLEREVIRTLGSWRFSRLPLGVPQQSQWATITFRFSRE